MATIQTVDRGMIKAFLDRHDIDYLTDRDGDFQATYHDDGKRGCTVTFWLMLLGEKGPTYAVRATSDRQIPRAQWGRTLVLCNKWNQEKLWPKAYLWSSDPDAAEHGRIVLEGSLYLGEGVHQELLDDFSARMISFSLDFWAWAHLDQGF